MPLLKRILNLSALIGLGMAVSSCDRPSSEYKQLTTLPYSQWNEYARSLPVERRLDLQREILERAGHNPPTTVSESFSGEPVATYEAILRRIRSGDHSPYYLGVIYAINRSPNFDMCRRQDRVVVQKYLRAIATDEVSPSNRPAFYSC